MKANLCSKGFLPAIIALVLLAGSAGCPKGEEVNQPDTTDIEESDIEDETSFALITGTGVNVRKGPGINYEVEFQLGKGDKVEILEIRGIGEACQAAICDSGPFEVKTR